MEIPKKKKKNTQFSEKIEDRFEQNKARILNEKSFRINLAPGFGVH